MRHSCVRSQDPTNQLWLSGDQQHPIISRKGASQPDNDRNCQSCISRNTEFSEGWFTQAAFVGCQMAPDRSLSAVLPYEHGLQNITLLIAAAEPLHMHFWSCALWRCHPRLWWFLHVGHDGDTVNKCNTEPQTAHCVWTSVRHPPPSSQCCYLKRISCWLQFLPEVAFFLHWDQTETNLCRAGKPVAVWEVRGGMASTVFSTSAATLMKRNHLTCLIGEKQVEHVAWREGEKKSDKIVE